MSDTPRTDAAKFRHCANWQNKGDHVREIVFAEDMDALERELTQSHAQYAELVKEKIDVEQDAVRLERELDEAKRAYAEAVEHWLEIHKQDERELAALTAERDALVNLVIYALDRAYSNGDDESALLFEAAIDAARKEQP